MKLKGKFLTSIAMFMLFVCMLKSVLAVGSVYQTIIKYDTNESALIYRTIARPHTSTLNIFDKYNDWKASFVDSDEPTWQTYKAKDLIFTKGEIGVYGTSSNSPFGYARFLQSDSNDSESQNAFLSSDPAAVKKWVDTGYAEGRITHVKNATVDDKKYSDSDSHVPTPMFYAYSNNSGTPRAIMSYLNKESFDNYNANTISSVGASKVFPLLFNYIADPDNKGYLWVRPFNNSVAQFSVSGVVPFKTIRAMLYTTDANLANKMPSSNDSVTNSYYIEDVYLEPTVTQQLLDYYNNCQDQGNQNCNVYVSAIPATNAIWSDSASTKFYMLTPASFLYSKVRDFYGNGWSAGTLGRDNDGLGSGLNLWDNKLVLPTDVRHSKKIVVNHIALKNGEKPKLLESEERAVETLTAGNNSSSFYGINSLYLNSDKTLTTSVTKSKLLVDKTTIQENMLQYEIIAPKANTKYKVNKLTNLDYGYNYIGYMLDTSTKIETLTSTYFENKYNPDVVNQQVEPVFDISDDTDEIIINLYYKMDEKNVNVINKVCKDNDGILQTGEESCVTIEGNKQIDLIHPENQNHSVVQFNGNTNEEKYTVNAAYDVEAENVNTETYEYVGYELKLTKDGSERIIRNSKEESCIATAKETGTDEVTITFYYTRKTTITKKPESKPNPDVPGTLTVLSTNPTDRTCEGNLYSVPTNARDNTNDVYVGLKNTPTYVLAGINVEQKDTKSSSHKVKINLTINFGPNKKTWTIEVPYSLSYYAIQELLIYKYKVAEIYSSGMANTKGEPLFNEKVSRITPVKTSELTLNASANSKISYTDTNNWKNYLVTSFKTNYIIPNEYSGNSVEASSNRKNLFFKLFLGYQYKQAFYYSPYEETNNRISDYIKVDLAEQYKNIKLDGQASITINLLDEDTFKKLDKNNDKEITLDDLKKFEESTNNAEAKFETAKSELGAAEDDYLRACNEYGYAFPCKDAVISRAKAEKKKCESEVAYWYDVCVDSETTEDGSTNCLKYEKRAKMKVCSDCDYCTEWRGKANKASSLDSTWNKKRTNYNTVLAALKFEYGNEVYAIQHFDEAYYIQENLWNKYKKLDVEGVSKLIGLDVKFDYSSGNAKLGDVNLMTVVSHTYELKSDNTIALSGRYGEMINLVASRQTLTSGQKNYYINGIPASWIENSKNGIGKDYYSNNTYKIPITRLNGTRILAGRTDYSIDTSNRVGKSSTISDNMYYTIEENKENKVITEHIFDVNSNSKFSKSYGVTQKNSEEFNVYTPLKIETTVNQDIDIIDQTKKNNYSNTDVIQANSTFTVNFNFPKDKSYTNQPSNFTSRYKHTVYIKFEFAVTNANYIGSEGYSRSHGSYEANEWIGPIYGDSITAVPYLNTVQGESVTDQTYNYYVIATAVNTNESWTKLLLSYINTSLNDLKNSDLKNTLNNACGDEGVGKLSYYADNVGTDGKGGTLIIVNRIYDFRVTDLKDIDWKDVFRNNLSSSFVNQHSGIAYYAGLNKWNTKNPLKYNQIIGRTEDEIGTSPSRILPLGPYKNTNTSYISAPKMGYRFSFDFKVSGAENSKKYVEIYPSFYYVSKDGKNFYTEGKGGIYLFYKNSQGQYVKVGSGSDNYKIQFTPNDGYRSLVQTDVRNLNSKVVTLGSLTDLKLTYSQTTTVSINDAAITYYGEYKLPNSTIAVKVDNNGNYDINKPLTDGYIGVVFDIRAHEPTGVDLVYGKNSYNNKTNTSQWDYEGYLGMSKPGSSYSTTLKLEKGTWKIDNTTYNKIKGTVILYDTDSRASNDFN